MHIDFSCPQTSGKEPFQQVHPWSANGWGHPESMALLTDPKNPGGQELLLKGRAPVAVCVFSLSLRVL